MPDPIEVIRLGKVSPFTGKMNFMTLPISEETFADCLVKSEQGMLIQRAFHMLNADQREFIKTGLTPEDWI